MPPRPRKAVAVEIPSPLPIWAAVCFLASGAAGLVYEIVWSKQISYMLGNSLYAVSTVVAAFLTGLALGAYVLGVRVARLRRGARGYAALELGIGILGLVSMPVLRGLDPVVGVLYRSLGGESALFATARFLLLFLILLPPTALMGATLPVLVGHLEHRSVGPALARLYAINTAGAVMGSALAGFALLPGIGLTASTWVAALLNVVAAGLAWRAGGSAAPTDEAEPAPVPAPALAPAPARASASAGSQGRGRAGPPAAAPAVLPGGLRALVAVIFALSGLAALAFQITWVRLFGQLLGSSVYSFSEVLAVYLTGLALGSALVAPWLRAARRADRFAQLLALLGMLQVGLAVVTLATVYLFPRLPEAIYSIAENSAGNWSLLFAGEAGLIALVLFVPCVGFGAVFPLAARLLQSRDGGHATGLAYAVNTVGTLSGSLLAGFLLIPTLGVQGTHIAAALLAGAVGIAALGLATVRGFARARAGAIAAAAVLLAALLLAFAPPWDPGVMASGVYRPAAIFQVLGRVGDVKDPVRAYARTNRTLFYREGAVGSVCVGADSSGVIRWLKVDGKIDASLSPSDMATQVMLGVLPMVMSRPGARVAIVGLGSGVTLSGALAAGAGPVEVMELEPAVVEASRFFDEPGHRPLDDPRVRLIVGDARTRLWNARATFDVVISEPSNPWIAGVNNLFTVDFYRRLRARLAPDGVFCQWVQLYELSPGTVGSLLRAFLEVFPHGHAFLMLHAGDLLLVATPPGRTLSLDRLQTPEVLHQMGRAGGFTPGSLAAWYSCPFDSLRPLTRGAPLNRDDLPVVEYRAPREMYRIPWSNTSVGSLVPMVGWRTAQELFADWPVDFWHRARVRALVSVYDLDGAAAAIRDASAGESRGLAPELTAMLEAGRHDRAVELDRAARDAMMAGNSEEARMILLNAVRVAPRDGPSWVMLAHTHLALGNLPAARQAAAKALEVGDPLTRANALQARGLIDMSAGKPRDAIPSFAEATRLAPQAEDGWLHLAGALRTVGDTAGAADACRRGLAANPSSTQLQALLGQLAPAR